MLWHENLADHGDLLSTWVGGLRKWSEQLKHVCKVGTLFSGSDLIQQTLYTLSAFWRHTYDVNIKFEFVFAAEKDPAKRRFLVDHQKVSVLFGDCKDCCHEMAKEVETGQLVPVPWCDWLWAGFPCTSQAKPNNNRSLFQNCVAEEKGATGEGFAYLSQYVATSLPEMITVENFETFADGGLQSDAQFIAERFRSLGYWAEYYPFDAADYGSVPTRARCYWHCQRGSQSHN